MQIIKQKGTTGLFIFHRCYMEKYRLLLNWFVTCERDSNRNNSVTTNM